MRDLHLGLIFKSARQIDGLKQHDIADRTRFSLWVISRFERGVRAVQPDELSRLRAACPTFDALMRQCDGERQEAAS